MARDNLDCHVLIPAGPIDPEFIMPFKANIDRRPPIPIQKALGYNKRSSDETSIGRYKRVVGGSLRFRTDVCRATEVAAAVYVLDRMLEIGRPISVRIG